MTVGNSDECMNKPDMEYNFYIGLILYIFRNLEYNIYNHA